MKFYLIGLFSLFLLVNVARAEDDLALPKKCEDVLSAEHCEKLRDFAATLKVKAAELDEKIRELVAQGKTKASEIYQRIKQYYRNLLAIRKCEDVLSAEHCAKLRAAAAAVKAKAEEIEEAIREAVARGKVRAKEIYAEALNFFRTRVLNKKCEDFMSAQACAKLRKMAETMKEKAQLVDEYVKRAVLEGKKKAAEIYKKVQEFFHNLVNVKTCDDLLPGETCDKLRELSQKLRLRTQKATEAVREAFKKGYQKVATVTANAIEKVKDLATNTQCEDVISASACAKLRATAEKIKVGAKRVEAAVKDAVAKSIFFGKDLMARAREFLKEGISCERVLGASTCSKIRKLASSVGVAAAEAERVIKEKIMMGINRLTDVYEAVLKFFKDKVWEKLKKWVPRLGKRDLEKRDFKSWLEKAKAKAKAALEKAKDLLAKAKVEILKSLKGARARVRELVAKAIREGKVKLDQLEKFVKEMMDKYGPSGEELQVVKRGFVDDLREAAKKAKGAVRDLINKALEKGGDVLKNLRGVLEGYVKELLGKEEKRELESDVKIMTSLLEEVTKRETEEMAAGSILASDAALDEAFEELEDLADDIDDHSYSKKREVESDFFMRLRDSLDALADNVL